MRVISNVACLVFLFILSFSQNIFAASQDYFAFTSSQGSYEHIMDLKGVSEKDKETGRQTLLTELAKYPYWGTINFEKLKKTIDMTPENLHSPLNKALMALTQFYGERKMLEIPNVRAALIAPLGNPVGGFQEKE